MPNIQSENQQLTMKRILFLVPILLFSCGDRDKDCNCNEVRTERTAIYTIGSATVISQLVSATEWQIVSQKPFTGDCDSNNKILSSGSFGAHPINSTEYIRTEYENKVSCK